jgi:cytosine/uracil/thiamine/allantoin permease
MNLPLFTLFALCVALDTASLYGNTMPDPVVLATMLVTVLLEDAFFCLFFGGPLK